MNAQNDVFRKNGARLAAGGSRKRRYAFTLVELLVVVAIIALLVSILLPSLGKAKEQAKMVMCMSNLKGLSLGFSFYTNENNEWYPKGVSASYDYETWDWVLKDYYGNRGLLHCPSDPPDGAPVCYATRSWIWMYNTEDDRYARSYAINACVSCSGPSPVHPDAWPGTVGKTTWVSDPGDTILLSECWYWSYHPGGSLIPGRYNRYEVGFTTTAWGFNPGSRDPTADVHRNKDAANYLFCDNHVVLLQKDDYNLFNEESDYYYFRREKDEKSGTWPSSWD